MVPMRGWSAALAQQHAGLVALPAGQRGRLGGGAAQAGAFFAGAMAISQEQQHGSGSMNAGAPVRFFNSLGREMAGFPANRHVGLYSCGPTVYSVPHLGNLLRIYSALGSIKVVHRYCRGPW